MRYQSRSSQNGTRRAGLAASAPSRLALPAVWGQLALMVGLTGVVSCKPKAPEGPQATQAANKQAVRPARIIAQGQLQPAGGLIRLNGTPGDAVEKILVSVGDPVKIGQPLVVLRSATARQSQLETLKQQLEDARLQRDANIDRAKIELSGAQLQLSQAVEQLTSLERRRSSLDLLKQQWQDAQAAFQRMETIAKDPLTKAMVSRLEIDKQRSSVTAAQLQFESQKETFEQAELTASSGRKLAEEKVRAAERSLALAEKIDPTSVLLAQIAGAEQQLALSNLTSPIDGTVVSLDARVGESIAQFPLVQVANLSRMNCQAEIYQTDAPLVKLGQAALLSSDAFDKPLRGTVKRIDRLIGFPQLRATDPLAKVDYRTLPVQIEVDAADVDVASHWLQLQVEVTIPLEGAHAQAGSGS
ncbi:MAG: efflux RND transporter periplasmic adaptor subunit [Pirellulaceae bacterium]|nr:efflux RND transporter periplasmic adaptor subunit [Pirellulaceae bacterium]